jgi:hypothetical protein
MHWSVRDAGGYIELWKNCVFNKYLLSKSALEVTPMTCRFCPKDGFAPYGKAERFICARVKQHVQQTVCMSILYCTNDRMTNCT